MNSFSLLISSPNGTVWKGDPVFLSLRGANGDLAVMAGHIPFVTPVVECGVKIELDDESELFGKVKDGLLTVGQNEATLLTGTFEWTQK